MSLFEPWIGNGIFRNDKTGVAYQSLIAVWADGYATYRSGIEAEILHRDLTLVRLESVSPVREYPNDTSPQFSALVQAVHSGNPVEIGALEPFAHTEDQQSYLTIDEFPVEPLDRQSGVWPMKNVPDALYDPLFGQPAPTEAEIAHYGGVEYVPPMKTYAILDAGKFQSGLSEFEDCGLPFRCLFKGDAAEEQKDVAPYLFELTPDSPFVRRLFTHLPDMPETMTTVHMWHREPGIYLRSRAGFDDVSKHFRKFTKVQDENGKWYYFRFWEPEMLYSAAKIISEVPVLSKHRKLFSALISEGKIVLTNSDKATILAANAQNDGFKIILNRDFFSFLYPLVKSGIDYSAFDFEVIYSSLPKLWEAGIRKPHTIMAYLKCKRCIGPGNWAI
ncbi:MAG: DUF4123 domain-containing protein [Rhodobacteraceae bacterium]|nr:MAG: DUF4123 domain-containing protein [Paracoccaceae bacterium]